LNAMNENKGDNMFVNTRCIPLSV